MILKKEPKSSAANIPEEDEVLNANSAVPNCCSTKTPATAIPIKDMIGRTFLLFGEIRSMSTINTKVAAIAISGFMKIKSEIILSIFKSVELFLIIKS
jgi:hypothetical protein